MKKYFFALSILFASHAILAQTIVINDLGVSPPDCHGLCNGSLNISASGTSGPYEYSIDGGNTYQGPSTFSSLCAGIYSIWVHDPGFGLYADTTLEITEPPMLTATTDNPTGLSCNGDCFAIATVAAAGGTGPYNYSWTSGGTGTFESNLCAGTHTATVTDSYGCTASADVIITEPSALTFNVTPTDITCNGIADGTLTFEASGGTPNYLYSINEGASFEITATYSGLSAGVRSVIVSDANGCESSSSTTINEPTLLSGAITSQTNILCHGDNAGTVTVAADVGTGKSPYLYSLDGGATTQASGTFNGLYAGSYPVTIVDDNGCTSDTSVTITESSPLSSHAGADTTVCEATSLTYGGEATGGSGEYFYTWDNGVSDGVAFNATVSATYVLTTEDSYGCFATDTVVVTVQAPPIADAGLDHTVCGNNVNVNLSGSVTNASGGMWEGGTGTFSPSSTDLNATYIPSANDISSGLVLLTLTTTSNGVCFASVDSSTITINPAPSVAASNNDISCFGSCDGNATVSATGGSGSYTYSWSSGGTASFETGLCAGTYTIAVSDANGCSITDSVIVTEPAQIMGSITSQTNASCTGVCDGEIEIAITGGTAPYQYSWTNGSTTNTASNLCAGIYTCTVTDADGCQESEPLTITEPNAITFSVTASNPTSCILSDGYLYIEGLLSDTTYNVTLTFDGDVIPTQPFSTSGSGTFGINGLSTYTITDLTIEIGGCSVVDTNVYNLTSPFNGLAINSGSVIVDTASCLNNDGNITGFTVSGGTSPYTYFYNGASSAIDLLNAQPGTYVLTVTDVNDCSVSSAAYTIESTYSNITASVTTTDVSCNGDCDGSVVASATGGLAPYTYLWTNGMSGGSITGVCGGSHGLFITDANGCESNNEVIINEPLSLSNTINTTNPGCGLSDGSAEVTTTSGGVTPYSYQWSNGSMLALADSVSSGVYTVTVTDANGCTSIETVSITSSTSPILTSNLTSPSCTGGSNGSIDLTITGGTAPIVFDWSTGESTSDISNLPAGIYDVTIMDASGCGIVEVFTLSDASPIDLSVFSVSEASCGFSDGSIEVAASGGSGSYNYLWSSGGSTAVESNLSPGTYTLSVSDANGCLAMANYTVSNESGPVITLDQVNEPTCQGGSGEILVSVSGGVTPYTYSWSTGANSKDLFNAPVGSYELIVTDSNGCQGVEYAELFGVNLNAAEICMVTVDTTTGSNIVVWNKELNLGISEYEIYKETSSLNVFQLLGTVPFDSLSQFIDTAANSSIHSYRYKLRTLDSCNNASEFLAYHKTIHLVSNIGLNSVVNLIWDDYIGFEYLTFYINRYHPTTGWEVLDSVAANVHSYTDNSYPSLAGLEYDIEVIPVMPCVAEKAQDHNTTRSNRHTIAPPGPPSPSLIDESTLLNARIQPNPSNGFFSIIVEASNWTYSIVDMNGKLIMNEAVAANNAEVHIEALEAGIYILQISVEGHSVRKKIVKQ